MTNKFYERVIKERTVDTRNYRYTINEREGEIVRLRIEYLDTTAAITEWETVKSL
jgi:hypothetical protein|nr:MAG TPA: hypothetical protein [Caudoviricetes sp.]